MPLDLSKIPGAEMTSPGQVAAHATLLFYGPHGCGKSTLAASASAVEDLKPVLALDFEGSMAVAKDLYDDVDVVRLSDWNTSKQVLDQVINQKHGYRTVILDPVNALQTQMKSEMLRRQALKRQLVQEEAAGKRVDQQLKKQLEGVYYSEKTNNSMGESGITESDWGVLGDTMATILDKYTNAPFLTIFTAHTVYDDKLRKVTPLMGGNIGKKALDRVPYITGYMEMRPTDDKGTQMPAMWFRNAKVGNVTAEAKDRSRSLGNGLMDPTMSKIWASINASNTEKGSETHE